MRPCENCGCLLKRKTLAFSFRFYGITKNVCTICFIKGFVNLKEELQDILVRHLASMDTWKAQEILRHLGCSLLKKSIIE